MMVSFRRAATCLILLNPFQVQAAQRLTDVDQILLSRVSIDIARISATNATRFHRKEYLRGRWRRAGTLNQFKYTRGGGLHGPR